MITFETDPITALLLMGARWWMGRRQVVLSIAS